MTDVLRERTESLLNGIRAACVYGLVLVENSEQRGIGAGLAKESRGKKFGWQKVKHDGASWSATHPDDLHAVDLHDAGVPREQFGRASPRFSVSEEEMRGQLRAVATASCHQ